jgi:alpha-glucosidase
MPMFILMALLLAVPAAAQDSSVVSPDGRTAIAVTRATDGTLRWRVTRAGVAVLEDSPLGIRRADHTFLDRLVLKSATEPRVIDERYDTPHGKRRQHRVSGNERTLTYANPAGALIEIVLRAQNEGAAIRYRFPESDMVVKRVFDEYTGFRVPAGSTRWLQPQQAVHRYGPAYEEFYEEGAAGSPAPRADGWSFPGLFKTPTGKWLLIAETGFDGTYCGSHLAPESTDNVYRIAFPDPREGMGVGEVNPKSTLPWATPWRVVVVGDQAIDILVSDLINDLSPPTRLKDTEWIKPGRAAWSWWSESNSPKHAARLNAFTDLAADMRWEYSLVDANWNFMETGTIEDVIAHAKTRSVNLLFWYNSGGPHNDVTEAPRDRMHERAVRRAEFSKLRSWGVKGVKVDFWHSDKQDRIQQYRDILEDAADFQIMVNFHGSTIPRGWSREFPHLMTMEGVFGAEQYKFREVFAKRAASHNTVLPFTRNVIGPMDYTPVTFTDVKFPRITTDAHELAQSVVFESGIQHYADAIKGYMSLPEAARTFLSQVPAAWDDTRGISGEPGKSVIVARRSGDTWYLGGLNADTTQTATLPLTLLGDGSWQMTLIHDGDQDRRLQSETRAVRAGETVTVPMRARGGFVARFSRR